MELHAAVLVLAMLGLAGSQAGLVGKGAAPRLWQVEQAINNIMEQVMQVTRETDEWLKVSELVRELELQARDLSNQLELELELAMSPELRQALRKAIHSTMRLVQLPLRVLEPYHLAVDMAVKQTTQALEQVLEQTEALGLDLPGALQAVTKWALELKEQLVGLPPISP